MSFYVDLEVVNNFGQAFQLIVVFCDEKRVAELCVLLILRKEN
jgi:hypothetical protein